MRTRKIEERNRFTLALWTLLVFLICWSPRASAQDLIMQRLNTVGSWRVLIANDGRLFNYQDTSFLGSRPGAGWFASDGSYDSLIFGGGLWISGNRKVAGALGKSEIEWTYDPSSSSTLFVPGTLGTKDGLQIDTSQAARQKNRVYRSQDLVSTPWPIRTIGGTPHYIDDLAERTKYPKSTIGDEDLFFVCKDTDPQFYQDSARRPFGIECRTQIAFWKSGEAKDAIVVHYQLLNRGSDTLFNPKLGFAMDGDVLSPVDDNTRTLHDELMDVPLFFTRGSTTDPLLGIVQLGGSIGSRSFRTSLTNVTYWPISADPITDAQKLGYMLSKGIERSHDTVEDIRVIMATEMPGVFAPGDTMTYDVAVFARPSTGEPALSGKQSSEALGYAERIFTGFVGHTLGVAAVPATSTSAINLNPMPAGSEVLVTVPQQSVGKKYELWDALGSMKASGQVPSDRFTLTLGPLPTGTYILHIEGAPACRLLHLR